MNISGKIIEDLSSVDFYDGRPVIYNAYICYEYKNSKITLLYKDPKAHSSTIALEGLWISSDNKSSYVDIFSFNKEYPILNFIISAETHVSRGKLLTKTTGKKPYKFIVIDAESWKLNELSFDRVFKYSFDDYSIYIRSNGFKEITCYDYNLKLKWEHASLEGQIYLDFEKSPQIHNNLLIINHAYHTIALNKKTGEEVWKHTFEDIPTSNVVMQGKIYAVCRAVLYIINPDTGEVELTRETGYPAVIHYDDNSLDEKNQIGVFPVGDYLYGIAKYDENNEWLRLYNHDASEVLDKKTIPDYCLNRYGSIMPTIHNGRIFQEVRNVYAYSQSGMMVLEISDDENATIEVAPRPPVTILASPALQEPHKLQIYLDVSSLDDALRYGSLYVSELLFAVGYNAMYEIRKNARDRQHTGELELVIDDSNFDDKETDEYLDELVKRVNESIENAICKAGDKKTEIAFSLKRQAKSEWNLTGEQLDWPAIRDQETPIS